MSDEASAVPQTAALVVAEDGAWFRLGDEPRVDLATRVSLGRLLLALATPPQPVLSSKRAFTRGWPGERALPKAASARVYTAIHTLRRMGLGDVITRTATGYRLSCEVRLVARGADSIPASAIAS